MFLKNLENEKAFPPFIIAIFVIYLWGSISRKVYYKKTSKCVFTKMLS